MLERILLMTSLQKVETTHHFKPHFWVMFQALLQGTYSKPCDLVEPTRLKNISQIGSLPQVEVKIKKNIGNHHPGDCFQNGLIYWFARSTT